MYKQTAIIILTALFLLGCGAYFGKQSQYDKGDWYLLASSSEVARMERNKQTLEQKKILDQLAVEKLKSQSADIQRALDGTPLGYKGIVANASRSRVINTVIKGCWNFSVGPQVQYYNGKGVHWYTVYNPN